MSIRALHGVNLTGWLSLESWVTPELFAGTGALSEDEIASRIGVELYHELVREHRSTFITESDFHLIARRGFNAVRLPVPWYAFGRRGPEPGPYIGCLSHVDDAFDWAEEVGLSVLLVMAVSPGNPNEAPSLVRNQVDFHEYREDLIAVIGALARRYATRVGFLGIEVADEPVAQVRKHFFLSDVGVPMHQLRNYYRDAYEAIREESGEETLVVLPDCGQPGAWRSFMAQDNYRNVWLDMHLFHHTDNVDAAGPTAVHRLAERSRAYLDKARKAGFPTMVGKWSASLPYADAMMTPEGQIALARVYVSEQLKVFSDCSGWFFQTWKTSGKVVGWDARIALATFERRMLA